MLYDISFQVYDWYWEEKSIPLGRNEKAIMTRKRKKEKTDQFTIQVIMNFFKCSRHYTVPVNKYRGIVNVWIKQKLITVSGNINPGKYEYPFKFVLTSNIPSTYNGAHGHIRYFIRANVDIQKASGHEIERQFTVFSPINFNNMLNRIELVRTYTQRTFVRWSLHSNKPLQIRCWLN